MLSDGIHYVTAMLTSQLNHFVNDGSLQKYTVIRLKDYFANQVSGRKCVSAAPRARNLATSRTAMLAPLPPACLLYTSPSPRDRQKSRMPSSA